MRNVDICRLAVAIVLGVSTVANDASAAGGKEYNQRSSLDPAQWAKVQRVIVSGRTAGARQEQTISETGDEATADGDIVNTGCGKLSFGNVEATGRPGQRLPRENIVVVRDVINAPINCGARR
jgi:hypothetical protein